MLQLQHYYVCGPQVVLQRDRSDGMPAAFGLTLSGGTPCTVSRVTPGLPAHRAGLCPGDVISRVNGHNMIGASTDCIARIIR
jgi:S1-C subfamily serine protease